jgi:hypothetical protein
MRCKASLLDIKADGISRGRFVGLCETASVLGVNTCLWETLTRCRGLVVRLVDEQVTGEN